MNDLLTRDPNESDEFPLGIGETLTRIIPAAPGEATEELGKYFRPDAPFPHLRHNADVPTSLVTDHGYDPEALTKPIPMPRPSVPPQPQPNPAPKPNAALAAAQPIAPLERVAGVADTDVLSILGSLGATVDGELFQAPLPRPIPPSIPPPPRPTPAPRGYIGRHRDPLDRVAVEGEGHWGRLVEAAKPGPEPRSLRVLVGLGAFAAFAAAVTTIVLVVFW